MAKVLHTGRKLYMGIALAECTSPDGTTFSVMQGMNGSIIVQYPGIDSYVVSLQDIVNDVDEFRRTQGGC